MNWLTTSDAENLIGTLIARYRRLGMSPLVADDDLRQEGRLALVRAERTFNPQIGKPVPFAWRALVLAMGAHVARMSSPVSGDVKRKGRPNRGARVSDIPGTERIGNHEGHCSISIPAGLEASFTSAPADGEFDEQEWRASVRERLAELSADEDAIRVALDLETPSQRAAKTGRPLRDIYKATFRLRKRAMQDVILWQLLQSKDER